MNERETRKVEIQYEYKTQISGEMIDDRRPFIHRSLHGFAFVR
jgi:hypothetical protein